MNQPDYRLNKYLPAAVLYFFLNGLLLPVGLLYTTLLTPLLLPWAARRRYLRCFLIYFLVAIPFLAAHLLEGVGGATFYLFSLVLSFSVFVFCIAFHHYISSCYSLRVIYKQLLLINAVLVLIALLLLPFPAIRDLLWNGNTLSLSSHNVERLKLFTYEPSYYSTLFAPIAIYYLLKVFRKELPQPALHLVLVLAPLFLSLSFGVILGMALSFFLLLLLHSRRLLFHAGNLRYVAGGAVALVVALGFFWYFFPDNIFFRRLQNILAGQDTSFNGRTFDSYLLCLEIAGKKSLVWGAGLGQVKVIGPEIFGHFYHDNRYTVHDVAIPNSMGDLLATLGLAGVGIKLFLEIYFFFKTRVFTNYYRLTLFLFIFSYQFTGSFIMNIAEYAIWILAFKAGLFPEFDKQLPV
jgi:hypothetical protein